MYLIFFITHPKRQPGTRRQIAASQRKNWCEQETEEDAAHPLYKESFIASCDSSLDL